MKLRPYQVDIINEARALMTSGNKSVIIQSPTGSGKTLLTADMLGAAADKGMTSWFVVHRRELIKQSMRTFADVGIPHGVVAAGFMGDPMHKIQIASVQTLARRHHRLRPPSLIVWDECHHVAAKSWSDIHAAFPKAYHIGLTATPERLDGKGLGKWFSAMVHGPAVTWLVERGFLVPYKLFAPSKIDLSDVRVRMGDYDKPGMILAVDKPKIIGDAIEHYQKHAPGKRAVVFCASIKHSKHVVNLFNEAGIPAAHVDGETDTIVRDEAVRRFERGEIKILSNVELFGEGFDLPALEVAILLRPTKSLGLYLQQVGRSLRPSPNSGKQAALILDHAGNCERHGLPDEERAWSLAGRAGSGGRDGTPVGIRTCPKCYAVQRPGSANCRFCGALLPVKSREIQEQEGELVEVDKDAMRRRQAKRQQGRADSLEDLVALGRERGYRRPFLWAKHVFNARQARRIRQSA